MKIIRTSNEFEDEGRDPLELPKAEQFETEEKWMKQERGEGVTHTSQIISDITPVFQDRLSSYYVANGSVAWFEYKDGTIYEVLVTPLAYSQHKNLLEKKLSTIDQTDNLT